MPLIVNQKPHQAAPKRIKNNDKAVTKKRARSIPLPLNGKTIAVSALQGDSSIDISSSTIIELCKSAGAQYTAQVHRKIYCLVATPSAVKGATQRVRKAWRRKIPIVSVDWVKQCIQTEKLIPMKDYLMEGRREENESSMTSTSSQLDVVSEERTVELGCCCVCHETEAADCEWCTDCVMNR